MRYEFTAPGTANELPGYLATYGRRGLLVESRGAVRRAGPAGQLGTRVRATGLIALSADVAGEPTAETVQRVVEEARAAGCDYVLAIGGGSVIDTGKAAAALLANPGSALAYLEVVGGGRPLERPRHCRVGWLRLPVSLRSPAWQPTVWTVQPFPTLAASSTRSNPVMLTVDDLAAAIENAW